MLSSQVAARVGAWRAARSPRAVVASAGDTAFAFGELLTDLGPRAWTQRNIEREAARRGIPPVDVIVDEELRDAVETIDCPSARPHRRNIRFKAPRGRVLGAVMYAFAIALMLFVVLVAFALHIAMGIAILGAAVGTFALLRAIRLIRARLGCDPAVVIAGRGYLVTWDGDRYVARKSIMVIRRLGDRGILVEPMGTAGKLELAFDGADDVQFIGLWQRWTYHSRRGPAGC